jgi:ribulose 1,5-bisphosphate synthetase/thiazole synthase
MVSEEHQLTKSEKAVSAIPADDELLDVIVVGASQAGLAMAWHLARQQLRFAVPEAGPRARAHLARYWSSAAATPV